MKKLFEVITDCQCSESITIVDVVKFAENYSTIMEIMLEKKSFDMILIFPKFKNWQLIGTEIIAKACAKHAALLVHISTDYVFEGTRTGVVSDQVGRSWLAVSASFENIQHQLLWELLRILY